MTEIRLRKKRNADLYYIYDNGFRSEHAVSKDEATKRINEKSATNPNGDNRSNKKPTSEVEGLVHCLNYLKNYYKQIQNLEYEQLDRNIARNPLNKGLALDLLASKNYIENYEDDCLLWTYNDQWKTIRAQKIKDNMTYYDAILHIIECQLNPNNVY